MKETASVLSQSFLVHKERRAYGIIVLVWLYTRYVLKQLTVVNTPRPVSRPTSYSPISDINLYKTKPNLLYIRTVRTAQ